MKFFWCLGQTWSHKMTSLWRLHISQRHMTFMTLDAGTSKIILVGNNQKFCLRNLFMKHADFMVVPPVPTSLSWRHKWIMLTTSFTGHYFGIRRWLNIEHLLKILISNSFVCCDSSYWFLVLLLNPYVFSPFKFAKAQARVFVTFTFHMLFKMEFPNCENVPFRN